MAIQVNIEKNFKGFSLKSVFESNTSATGILGASGSGKEYDTSLYRRNETPDRGKIVINGRTVFDSEKKINLKPAGASDWVPVSELCIVSDNDSKR